MRVGWAKVKSVAKVALVHHNLGATPQGKRMKDFWPFKKFNTSVFGVRYSVFKIQNIEYRISNTEYRSCWNEPISAHASALEATPYVRPFASCRFCLQWFIASLWE
jgi:hypothetical protein